MKKLVREMFAHEIAKAISTKNCIIGDAKNRLFVDDIQIVNWTVVNGYDKDILCISYRCKYDENLKGYHFDYETAYIEYRGN